MQTNWHRQYVPATRRVRNSKKQGVENTLRNVGRLGKEGMKETNDEIIKIMIGENETCHG